MSVANHQKTNDEHIELTPNEAFARIMQDHDVAETCRKLHRRRGCFAELSFLFHGAIHSAESARTLDELKKAHYEFFLYWETQHV